MDVNVEDGTINGDVELSDLARGNVNPEKLGVMAVEPVIESVHVGFRVRKTPFFKQEGRVHLVYGFLTACEFLAVMEVKGTQIAQHKKQPGTAFWV